MLKRSAVVFMALFGVLLLASPAFCGGGAAEMGPQDIIAVAKTAVKGAGIEYAEADVLYIEDSKVWVEKIGIGAIEDKAPNRGNFAKGVMKHYKVVCFDFKEPVKDVFVFVNAGTGEVITVYRQP